MYRKKNWHNEATICTLTGNSFFAAIVHVLCLEEFKSRSVPLVHAFPCLYYDKTNFSIKLICICSKRQNTENPFTLRHLVTSLSAPVFT